MARTPESCRRSGHGCRRRRSRRAFSHPPPRRPPARASPRCRWRCGPMTSTAGRSTGSRARGRRPASAGSRLAPGLPSTASSARGRAGRSAGTAATRSGAARSARGIAAGTSPRCSSRSRPTASRAGPSTAASAPAPRRRSAARRRSPGCRWTASPDRRRSRRSPARRSRAPALRLPIQAPLGDRYGPRGAGFHAGLDFPAPSGRRVTAAASGRVAFAGWDDGWGLTVTLDHGNGIKTRYAHLSEATVRPGTAVARGLDDRPGRRDRLRHRPASALRGHGPRRERGPRAGVRALTRRRERASADVHVKGPLAASRRQERGAARDSARVSTIRSKRCSQRAEVEQDQPLVALLDVRTARPCGRPRRRSRASKRQHSPGARASPRRAARAARRRSARWTRRRRGHRATRTTRRRWRRRAASSGRCTRTPTAARRARARRR